MTEAEAEAETDRQTDTNPSERGLFVVSQKYRKSALFGFIRSCSGRSETAGVWRE